VSAEAEVMKLLNKKIKLHKEIGDLHRKIADATEEHIFLKEHLTEVEDDLLLGLDTNGEPLIKGKNQEIRDAMLRQYTRAERQAETAARVKLMRLVRELEAKREGILYFEASILKYE
jgi:hypothetical protein